MKRLLLLLICLVSVLWTACTGAISTEPTATTTRVILSTQPTVQTTDQRPVATQTTAQSSRSTLSTTVKPVSSSKKATTSQTTTTQTTAVVTQPTVVPPSGEMRATWASYIELNKLFSSCTTEAQAKAAIDGILDTVQEFRLNTLYFHVRANSDAYYRSAYFKPAASVEALITAGFDPLQYAVDEAHKRGIALHAWVNPYRVGFNTKYLVKNVPTFQDAAGRYYYVPTSLAAQRLILDGIRELVNNYAIDGIQYDDYFYPSGLLSPGTVYSYESADYSTYKNSGGTLSVANWRRAAVDTLVASTHTVTQAKHRIFGVSPAADADKTYNQLYANPKKWMSQSGYIDYICPQIYTGFEHGSSPFDDVTDEWLSYPRHSSVKLYVGIAAYKAGLLEDTWAGNGKREWATHNDILKCSVAYLRSQKVSGMAFYSYSYLKPDNVVGLSATNAVTIARKEMENLLTVL